MTAPDMVNHPPHYTANPSGVECIQVTRWMNFNVGNAVKYLWRVDTKGHPIENLRKAAWYIADEIKRLEGPRNPPHATPRPGRPQEEATV